MKTFCYSGEKSRELGAIVHNQNAVEAENKALALDLLNASDFEERFCGDYISLQQQISELDQALLQSQERQRQFETWRHQAEAIDAEFTRIA